VVIRRIVLSCIKKAVKHKIYIFKKMLVFLFSLFEQKARKECISYITVSEKGIERSGRFDKQM